MGVSVGAALLLFLMHFLHYGGKDSIYFCNRVLTIGENPHLDRVAWLWWLTIGIAWVLPFLGIATGLTTRDPFTSTTWHAGFLFVVCLAESTYLHKIEDALAEVSNDGEQQGLTCDLNQSGN